MLPYMASLRSQRVNKGVRSVILFKALSPALNPTPTPNISAKYVNKPAKC